MSFGSAGRALAFAELGLAELEESALAILRQGDPTNARRSELASELGKKARPIAMQPSSSSRRRSSHGRRGGFAARRSNARWMPMPRPASSLPSLRAWRSIPPRPCSRSAASSPRSRMGVP